jgi:hypothetical protein
MRKRIALVSVLALALSLVATAAFARASLERSTGGVGFTTQSDNDAHASFNAHATPTGAKGQVEVKNHGPNGDIDFHGVVDCYHRVSDNEAVFSGEITQIDGASSTHFRIAVEDNGQGRNADPDKITVQRHSAASDCQAGPTANRAVDQGNLRVHH